MALADGGALVPPEAAPPEAAHPETAHPETAHFEAKSRPTQPSRDTVRTSLLSRRVLLIKVLAVRDTSQFDALRSLFL